MSVKVNKTGERLNGTEIAVIAVEIPGIISMECLNLGCIITRLYVPDRDGRPVDVVLGFDNIEDYLTRSPKCGAVIGRYANRIDGSSFELNGRTYNLDPSRDGYTIHGGPNGFDKRVFEWSQSAENSVTFKLKSPDGDAGFPGSLSLDVTYSLEADCSLNIKYSMTCDADTIVNITNHSYFNLSGAGNGDICDHSVFISSNMFCESDSRGVPTGRMLDVSGTPMDFRTPQTVGQEVDVVYDQLNQFGGFDHSYQLNEADGGVAASAWSPVTGIRMDVETTMPAVQFYTSNGMHIDNAKDGRTYGKRAGMCFETQYHPDTPHHSEFPSCILREGEIVVQRTRYKFSVADGPQTR